MPRRNVVLFLVAMPLLAVAGKVDLVSVEKKGERYLVDGEIVVNASTQAVYRLITNYDALEQLDKGIAESRLIERVGDTTAMVYTRLKGCIVFFCRKVERMERVEEIGGNEIVALVVPGEDGDVRYQRSQWLLFTDGTGTRVVFHSEVEPDFWIPAILGPAVIRNVLKRRVTSTLNNMEQAALAYE